MIGQPAHLGAVGVHDADFQVPVTAAAKSDLRTVWGPGRIVIRGDLTGQTLDVLAVSVRHIDFLVAVARAYKGHLFAVRRPARRLFESPIGDENLVFGTIAADGVNLHFAIGPLED